MDVSRLAQLPPAEKRQLLAALLRRQSAGWPVSYGQRAMWFLQHLDPQNPVFVLAFAARLAALPDVAALRRAAQRLLDRHPVLTCAFHDRDGQPLQVVRAHAQVDFAVVDTTGWDAGTLQARLLDEAHRPFDLARDPLFRVRLYQRDGSATLLWTFHHIVTDLRSLQVLLEDLGLLYAAECAGAPAPLLPPGRDYGDFARWQAELLAGPEGERLWAYWRDRLAGDLPVLDLAPDRTRPPVHTSRGGTRPFALDDALASRLRTLARAEGVTLYTLLLAAFQTLLHRYTGQDDILVGSPVAARGRPEFARAAGYFANMVVLRADLSGDPPFRDFLARARRDVLGALEHQDFPFALLVERLRPARDPSRTPLFQAAFALQQASDSERRMGLGGLAFTPLSLERRTADFDLALTLREEGEGLRGFVQYSTELFEPATADRLIAHYQTLLEAVVADPDRRLSELPLMTAAERRLVLDDWSEMATTHLPGGCVHERIAEQARRTPDAVAVWHAGAAWTYDQLNRRASRLAYLLRARGVGPDAVVGLCCERSFDLVAGILGVLKAGGSYLPLDPAHPAERLALMLRDAAPRAVLTQCRLRDRLAVDDAAIICLDSDWEQDGSGDHDPPGVATPDHLAYVIYTSGSTGTPKGVAVPHRALANYTGVAHDRFALGPADRVLQFASASFDAHAEEIFPCLSAGATLVLRTEEMLDSVAAFFRLCGAWGVTVASLPTAFWHELAAGLDGPAASLPSGLRLIILGGERVLPERLARWRERVGGRVRLLNTYGPTEATVVATMTDLTDGPPGEAPIGRPIPNARAYVLDRHRRPVPVGVPGELCLGGTGLARGYLGDPARTAEQFVTVALDGRPPGRLYRTGDKVRWRADGQLEFLGRLDEQVKVRGFRVEPAEVEAQIAQFPAVREAAVVARDAPGGGKQLVAYVVAAAGAAPPDGELRDFLSRRLPDYMVPSAIVPLPGLPRTPGGKVDRSALPAPAGVRPDLHRPYVAPRTPTEEALAEAWREVLRVDRVGAHDNFFELGGHSLLAVQVVSRVRERLGIEVPLRGVFEEPTVANLAARIDAARVAGDAPTLPPIPRALRDEPLPLSFAQERLWFLDQLEPDSPFYNMPAAVRLTGPLDVAALEQSLRALIERHESLRTTFEPGDGRPVQVIAPTRAVAVPMTDLSERPAAEREAEVFRRALEEGRRPFDLRCGPLLRVSVLRLSPREHVLLAVMHHIVSDGWSVGVLVGETLALYEAFARGRSPVLPPLPVQYADYALWQRQWLRGDETERQLTYWRRRLDGLPTLALPTDRLRPVLQSYRGASLPFTLTDELAGGLRDLGTREGATLFMTLLAAFQTLLGRYAGQDDFAVGSPVAGRGRAELEGLIGFFVNALVLRADLSGDPTFRELLGRVRETALGAYAHQDVPFAKLVEALRPPRDASRHPFFQVLFVLQNAPTAPPPGLGRRAELLWLDLGVARHDLTLDLVDEGEGLHGRWEFNTDLFDEDAVRRMHDQWLTLLGGVVADPGRKLSELPLPPRRGAVNLRALPVPVADQAAARFVEPRTPAERALAAIWAELLGVERVGAEDNFFELGGESLLAVRMTHRVREAGLPLTLRDLFLHQTVAELAARAEGLSSGAG